MADQFQLVTGGVVSIEDGVKKNEEYAPPRKVRVELHFALPDGAANSQAYLDAVSTQADNKVQELLGCKVAPKPQETVVAAAAPAKPDVAPTGKTKADLAAAAGVSEEHVVAATPKAKGPPRAAKPKDEPKPDPAAIVDEEPAAEAEAEESFDIPATEEAKPISDEDLNNYVGKVNQKFRDSGDAGGPPKIREVIGAFKPEGWTKMFTIRDIAQQSRAAFKDKLKALLPDDLQKGL